MRITVCDQCDKRTQDHQFHYLGNAESQWIALDVEANEDSDHGQFCSWTCLALWAREQAIRHEGDTVVPCPDCGGDAA